MANIECYRFVEDDLTSAHGDLAWRLGEWNTVGGTILCSTNGLHASERPRDSVRNVYGRRWFIAEARGVVARQDNKLAASEMRLVEEIHPAVLRSFAVSCARRSYDYLATRHTMDARLLRCIQTTEDFLAGSIGEVDLLEGRNGASAVAAEATMGPDTGRATAAAIAASCAANGEAAPWTAAAAGAAHAACVAADAIDAAGELLAAQTGFHNVARGFAAARTADRAAAAAHAAAASGAIAHAGAVAAASGSYAPDTASDRYFAAWEASTALPDDGHYLVQNADLAAMIANSRHGSSRRSNH